MPAGQIDPTLSMYYEDDYFGEAWLEPETVLLVHGVAESSRAWVAWVPHEVMSNLVEKPLQRAA